MSIVHVLVPVCEGFIAFTAYVHAALIETSIIPQGWLRIPSNKNVRLLHPTSFTIALYAASEPLWHVVWTRLLIHVPDGSFGACVASMAHAPALVAFALPDNFDRPSPSPWKNPFFAYALNMFLIQAAAAQNAAWLLMAFAPPEENANLRGLHVVFGLMTVFAATATWVFGWWSFVESPRDIRAAWYEARKDSILRTQLIRQTALLIVVRTLSRWILGLRLLNLIPPG